MESAKPKMYLLVHNIQKSKNIGMIVRSACAFNVHKIFTVIKSEEKKELKFHQMRKHFQFFGNQNTGNQIEFMNFPTLKDAKAHLDEEKIRVCGVEIEEGSQRVDQEPFQGDTCFILGNEGQGMIEVQKDICDQFVYIPQYTDKTASLNVAVAGSIVFHHFALWAGYQESKIFGEKFRLQDENRNKVEDDVQKQVKQ